MVNHRSGCGRVAWFIEPRDLARCDLHALPVTYVILGDGHDFRLLVGIRLNNVIGEYFHADVISPSCRTRCTKTTVN